MTIADKSSGYSFPVVGIGASAGGLYSLECFVATLPKEFGFAIVFMQHLSTKHRSLLPELLHKRRPDIEIIEISEGLKLLPGKLFLCPPGKVVRILKATFHVAGPSEEHARLPIDELFASLAEEAGERTLGVIFSGAGTDGARGIQAIRSAGGTVFVQDPATAEFASMPLAAIATGQADGVFKPEDLAREILQLYGVETTAPGPLDLIVPAQFEAFYRLLHDKTGYNFNLYKKSVVGRRITRRMYLRGVTTVDDYLEFISENGSEINNLALDLMIGVTSFFRDPLAWKALKTGVIRKLAAANDDSPVRVWTPASATGEEAYSIAMMLHHELDLAGRRREIQVFATDVNEQALEKAREGKYPAGISSEIPPDFMKKYFTYAEDGLSAIISKEIRGLVVFAKHDILTDPPFSRLDLVICRNLLIYLEPEAQEKCIALFHYGLKNSGFLFLGNAESPGRNNSLFKSLAHKKCRIYEKVETKPSARMPISVPFAAEKIEKLTSPQKAEECRQSVTGIVQETLLEKYAPAAVAVNQNYDIVYHNGPTNRYLCQPRGAPTQNLLELMPESLRSRIRSGLYRAAKDGKHVSIRANVPCDDGQKREVTISISQLRQDLFLFVFREKGVAPEYHEETRLEASAVEETAVRQLETELAATRQDLQSNIEQLKSLNEEMQSSNEELQAANEELETSREELQSLNEELITVNAQLQSKIEEQETTNNDLNNFLASTNIPTIFLDHQFRVKRFTPAMSRLIKLIPSDVGRPIIDMSQEGLGPELIANAQAVLDSLVPVKKEMEINSTWYVRTTLPYRTADNRIEGVVITYNDVTEVKVAEERTRHLASFPQLNPHPICEVDYSGKVTFCNPGAEKILEALGMDKGDLTVFMPRDMDSILGSWDKNEELSFYRELTIKDRVFGANIYLNPHFSVARIYAFDITERKRTENVMQARLRLATAAYAGDISADEVLRLTLDEIEAQTGSVIGFYHFLEADQETLSLQSWSTNTVKTMCNAEGKGSHYNISQAGVWVDCVRERRPVIHNDYASLPYRKGMPEGHAKVIREMVIPIMRGERIVAIIGVGNKPTDYNETDIEIASLLGDFSWEIVELKRAEEALRGSEEQFRTVADSIPNLAWWANADGYIIWYNRRWYDYTGTTPEQMEGWGWQSVHDPEVLPEVLERWKTSISTGEPFDMEFPLRGADGIFRSFLTRVMPLKDSAGSVLRWFGTNTDISALKKAEEDVLKLSEDMAEQNIELEEVNRELEAFIYSVSHDLRAPIRHMSSFAKFLIEDYADRLDEQGRDYLTRINKGSEKISQLISDLLYLSQISRQEISRTNINMSKLASSIVADLRETGPSRSVEVNIEEGLFAFGDERLITIALSNLLGNSWKFTSKIENSLIEFGVVQNPPLLLSTGQAGPSGRGEKSFAPTVYYVRDNGAGFDPEYMEKMFRPFQRLHSDKEFEGTGIGLTIVERVIRRHGGKIWAEGEIGKGATIYFTLE